MSDLLQQLRAAHTEEEREWLLMRFSLDSLDPDVRDGVWAAAIPRWFDRAFLSTLLEKPDDEDFAKMFDKLRTCSFVEAFPGRGYDIHERTRNLLLNHLVKDGQEKSYRNLNKAAADYCARQNSDDPSWRMAYLYHTLLTGEPTGVLDFYSQGINWKNEFKYDRLEALARPVIAEFDQNRMSAHAASWAYCFQAEADLMYSRFESAENNFKLALSNYSEDPVLRAEALKSLGYAYLQRGNLSAAQENLEEARLAFQKIGAQLGEANCVLFLGELLRYTGQNDEARQRYEEAALLFKRIGDELGEANCKLLIGNIYLYARDNQKARLNLSEALEVFRRFAAKQNETDCIKSLGDVAVELGEYDEARKRYDEARSLSRRIGYRLGEATAVLKLGRLLALNGDFHNALTLTEEALELYRQVGSQLGESNSLEILNLIKARLQNTT